MPQALRGHFVYGPASHKTHQAERDLLLPAKAPTCALLEWEGRGHRAQQSWIRSLALRPVFWVMLGESLIFPPQLHYL